MNFAAQASQTATVSRGYLYIIRSARAGMSQCPTKWAMIYGLTRMERFLPEIHMDNGDIAIVCGSYVMSFMRVDDRRDFSTEIMIHFSGLENLDKPAVLSFPRVLVCSDCGSSQFTLPETEMSQLTTLAAV